MNFDPNLVYSTDRNNFDNFEGPSTDHLTDFTPLFSSFIKEFRTEKIFKYSDLLMSNWLQGNFQLEVEFNDLVRFNPAVSDAFLSKPKLMLDQFSLACKKVIYDLKGETPSEFQVCLVKYPTVNNLRYVSSENVEKVVKVKGIITSSSKVGSRYKQVHLVCINCNDTRVENVPTGAGGVSIPRRCEGGQNLNCPMDPYIVDADKSVLEDFQVLKLQEFPEEVPSGEIPRSVKLFLSGPMVGRLSTGIRTLITGIFSLIQASNSSRGSRWGYIQVVGIESFDSKTQIGGLNLHIENNILSYQAIWKSIAPAIFGHDDIKKAIACQLFGGTCRELDGGVRLRGDMNILLLGDPSVAKSQFLKITEKIAPIAVYTSGKGSSAAGLTAAVIRDAATGEFSLEGGAMVLADGGLVCIDEFDKMREADRVAIHEAMEQQTISINKAGITSVLKSRTSVLAAANPSFGRYDTEKTTDENIDFQTSILSRFDLIFVILDKANKESDEALSSHIIDVHMGNATSHITKITNEEMKALGTLKHYIKYARENVFPSLDEEAAEYLANEYVALRNLNSRNSTIPITVRQLEAVVRITESLAKMELSSTANKDHAQEAIRLFKASTLKAAKLNTSRTNINSIFMGSKENKLKLRRILEESLKSKISTGEKIKKSILMKDIMKICNTDYSSVDSVLKNLINRNDFQLVCDKIKRIN